MGRPASVKSIIYGLSAVGNQSTVDQSVKETTIRHRKTPSKVNMAIGTNRNTPNVTGKPGKFRRCGPQVATSPGVTVTSNLKNGAFRIGKGVRVCTVDDRAFYGRRNHMKALAANNCTKGCCRSLGLGSDNRIPVRLFRLRIRSKQIRKTVLHRRMGPAAAGWYKRDAHGRRPVS